MRILIATLSIVFAACVIVVAFINSAERVTVKLWPESADYIYPGTSVSWVIFFSAFAGIVFMGIIAILEGSKTRLSNARLRAQIRRLQQELATLKRQTMGERDRGLSIEEPPPLEEAIEPDEEDETGEADDGSAGGVSRTG